MAWPSTVLDLVVEIYVSGGWVDITSYVRRRGGQGIVITDGTQGTQQRRAAPSQATMEINNRDGRFSPRNPASPYYGLLTVNTEMRIIAEGYELFRGEVSSGWPTRWTAGAPGAGDAWVPLRAGGRSERINADTTPLRDPLHTQALADDTYYPTYYWPLTDPPASVSAASGLDDDAFYGGTEMVAFGSHGPVFAGSVGPAGSSQTPDFSAQGSLTARLDHLQVGDFSVVIWFKLETGDSTDFGSVSLFQLSTAGSGANPTGFDVIMFSGLGLGTPGLDHCGFSCAGYTGLPQMTSNRSADVVLNVSSTPCAQSEWHQLRVTYEEAGGAITQTLYLDGTERGRATSSAGGYTLGSLSKASLNANNSMGIYSAPYVSATGLGLQSLASFGIYHGPPQDPGTYRAGLGWRGETAGERLERLCGENGIPITFFGDNTLTATMLAQRTGSSLASLLEDCAKTDGGLLHDAVNQLGLRYVTRQQLYGSATVAALALDYTLQAEVMPGLDTDESTFGIENDITASSDIGERRAQQLTGPRNVTEPSDGDGGVGRLPGRLDTDLDTVSQLTDAAAWAVWLGTTDVPRFTSIPVNLRALAAAGKTTLWQAAADALPGDMVTIANTPVWIPDDVACFVVGRTITLANYEWDIVYNTIDATAWQHIGGPLEDTVYGRLDSEDSYLLAPITSSATTIYVENTGDEAVKTLWTSADGNYPVRIDSEVMTVTAVSTITPSHVATGTAAHADNASVTPGLPGGTTARGDLLVLYAAIRNNAATVNTPAGYEVLFADGNVCAWAKVHTGTESAPTVTVSGGSAGDTVSAQMASLRGVSLRGLFLTSQANGSAQNIAYPAMTLAGRRLVVLWFGWKQDDWTSVANFETEIGEPSTTTGSDQGLVWNFSYQSATTGLAGSSWVVTGGAAAISKAYVVALDAEVQSFTVTRGAESTTAAAHVIGSQVRLAHPLRLGR